MLIDDLLRKNQEELEWLLDHYIDGSIPNEQLTELRAKLERIVTNLETERTQPADYLEAETLTFEQI